MNVDCERVVVDIVIFDKGGVLTRSSYVQMQRDFADAAGLPLQRIESYFQDRYPNMERGELSEQDFTEGVVDASPAYRDLLTRSYGQTEERIEHTWEMIRQLRQRGVRVGLMSNTIPSHAHISEQRGIYAGFDPVLLSCRLGVRKPEPEAWDRLVEFARVEPSRIGFVDDNPQMVEHALAYGLCAIRYQGPWSLEAKLRQWSVL